MTGGIRTPVGLVWENNQFGEGGAHECFIPESEFNRKIILLKGRK